MEPLDNINCLGFIWDLLKQLFLNLFFLSTSNTKDTCNPDFITCVWFIMWELLVGLRGWESCFFPKVGIVGKNDSCGHQVSNTAWCCLVLLQFSSGVINLGSLVRNLLWGRAELSWGWGCQGWILGAGTAGATIGVQWHRSGVLKFWELPSIYSRAREGSRSFWGAPAWLWNQQGWVLLWG